jgi:HK97 gp10 family phage protein
MAKNYRVDVEGDVELIRKLKAMSKGFRTQALLHAVTQGAEIVEREAKARAPVRKGGKGGTLRRSITTVKLKSTSKLAKVGVSWRKGRASRTDAFYGIMVEKGTKSRFRKKWRKKPLKKPASTGRGPERPFLIPAYLSKREAVAREVKVQLSRLIRRAAKKGL